MSEWECVSVCMKEFVCCVVVVVVVVVACLLWKCVKVRELNHCNSSARYRTVQPPPLPSPPPPLPLPHTYCRKRLLLESRT